MARVLGIVLAGGAGRRLGRDAPKAMVVLEGRTLLARALATLRELCDEVIVSTSPGVALGPEALDGAACVMDAPGAQGPLAGLVAGLEARAFERAIALGVDFPLVRPRSLRFVLDQLGRHAAALPAPDGRAQPLAAAYAPSAVSPLGLALRGGAAALVPAVMALAPRVLGDDELRTLDGGLDLWLNVNRPSDLDRAARALRAPHAADAA
jgi:molybdenum cofactor guanylyltransferase